MSKLNELDNQYFKAAAEDYVESIEELHRARGIFNKNFKKMLKIVSDVDSDLYSEVVDSHRDFVRALGNERLSKSHVYDVFRDIDAP